MANEFQEFCRNYGESYVLIKTESSEVERPVYLGPQSTRLGNGIVGSILHESSSKTKRETGITISSTNNTFDFNDFKSRFRAVIPESRAVNLPHYSVYLSFTAKRQYNKGWRPDMFDFRRMNGNITFKYNNIVMPWDMNVEVSYYALLQSSYPSFTEVLQALEEGECASRAFGRSLALGWHADVSKPVLYYRGQVKGILKDPTTLEVTEDIIELKDQIKRKWGIELVKTDAPGYQFFGKTHIEEEVQPPIPRPVVNAGEFVVQDMFARINFPDQGQAIINNAAVMPRPRRTRNG